MNAVQSAVTSTSFSEDLQGIFVPTNVQCIAGMNELAAKGWLTDIELLIEASKTGGKEEWTAPKWMTVGDILFFYQTKTAKKRLKKLVSDNEHLGPKSSLLKLLERNLTLAEKYSGTIFGCAEVTGPASYKKQDDPQRFGGRIFAEVEKVHIFENPLDLKDFRHIFAIGQNTITPLHGAHFSNLNEELGKHNKLPKYLANTEPGGKTFRKVDKDNWRDIPCDKDTRFIDESQLRAYLLDYLLNELKDSGTPLLKECHCWKNGKYSGRADYFVKINKVWIPVEAKLNVLAEKDILTQIQKYIDIDEFEPTLGDKKGQRFDARGNQICLIVDQAGVYFTKAEKFVGCSPGKPLWTRESLKDEATVKDIRNRISPNTP